jgi:hypothetical protein
MLTIRLASLLSFYFGRPTREGCRPGDAATGTSSQSIDIIWKAREYQEK